MPQGRIAVLMPEIYDPLDKEFLSGVKAAADEIGFDTLVFTSVSSNTSDSYICGENNIYELPFLTKIDGMIAVANSFRNEKQKNQVLERLEKSGIPCVVTEEQFGNIKGVFLDQSLSIYNITKHLTECHGYKNMICLTGPEGNREARERADGFVRAMNEKGLVSNNIIYGDFWRNAPISLAEKIAGGEITRPEAIVCTNDIMAVTLCQKLMEKGVKIPGDIAITGYDGSIYTLMTRPAITTVCGVNRSLGISAVKALAENIGIVCSMDSRTSYIRARGSCGCGCAEEDREDLLGFTEKILRTQLERKNFIFSNYIAKMSDCGSIPKFTAVLDSLRYMMSECKAINICICEDWRVDTPEYRKNGFSRNMELIYSENQPGQLTFPLETLLPQLEQPHEPQLWVFSSLHYSDRIIGYIASSYENAEQFAVDEHYIGWCDAVANGLDIVIKKSNTEYIWQKLEEKNMIDMHTGLLSRRGFLAKAENSDRIAFIKFPRNYADMQYFVIIVSAVLRSEKPEFPSVYLGENVFAVNIKSGNEEILTEDICHSLGELGIYVSSDKLMIISDNVTGVLTDERLSQMYSALTETHAQRNSEIYSDLFTQLRKEMRYSPQSDWSIAAACARTGLSGSHFQRLYKKYFGIAFNEEVIAFRLDRAKYLLTNTSLSVQQISEQCGYTNAAHFMRQFRQREGVSAGQYRKAQVPRFPLPKG